MGLGLGLGLGLGQRAGTPALGGTFDRLVIEGDSITSLLPSTYEASKHSYQYDDYRTDKTIEVRAQQSRIVGTISNLNDNGNSMMGNVSEDLAYGPQLITTMIGANDFTTGTDATYRTNLIDYKAQLGAVKFAWSAPIAYNPTGTPHPSKAAFDAQRATLVPACRNPAVWGQWADYYLPMGEYPDFGDAALAAPLFGDSIHPSAAGQLLLYSTYKPAIDTILDASKINATTPDSSVWPSSQTNLATSAVITDRFVVSGLAHTGTALGIGVSGASAQVRVNGGSYGTSFGTGSGNGYRLYNGDVVDVQVTTSASNDAPVSYDLTIGSETRTITKRTVIAVTPAAYVHGGIFGKNTFSTTFTTTAVTWPVGMGVIFVTRGAPTAITVNGVSAVQQTPIITTGERLEIWLVPISTAGIYPAILTYPNQNDVVVSMGTVTNADPTPTAIVATAPASESQPHLTSAVTNPASGVFVAALAESGGASITPGTANNGTQAGEANVTGNGETHGLVVSSNTTTGSLQASFNFAFGTLARGGVVFKALGT